MVGGEIFSGLLTGLMTCFIVAVIGIFGCGYFVYDKWIKKHEYISHRILIPEKRLHTDGKTIDTIYVYKF